MDYYNSLEISSEASEEEIKASYRRLSKKYHPDVNPGNAEAERRFKEISEAYAVLGDTEKRKTYDQKLQSGKTEDIKKKAAKKTSAGYSQFDINNMTSQFEHFFGFHPDSGKVNPQKINPQKTNPLDMTNMFEKYMGFQDKGGKGR